MKYIIALLFICVACSKDDDPKPNDMGCMSGIPDGQSKRVYIKCATYSEFQATKNPSGPVVVGTVYTNIEWKATASCADCN